MSDSTGKAAYSALWTIDVVANRATDLVRLSDASRAARSKYRDECAKFRARHGVTEILEREDPLFQKATRKPYRTLQSAISAERNAFRRLETAVRNCANLLKEL